MSLLASLSAVALQTLQDYFRNSSCIAKTYLTSWSFGSRALADSNIPRTELLHETDLVLLRQLGGPHALESRIFLKMTGMVLTGSHETYDLYSGAILT